MSDNLPSIEDALKKAIVELHDSGSDSAALDAAVLLCHALDKPRSYLLTWPEKVLNQQTLELFYTLMERRLKGEPVAYIVGEREFWSLPLKVSPSTLIPRPDTERLVELALEKATAEPNNILDLGTGTGAIALALASELPSSQVTGIDLRPEAVELATENAARLELKNSRFLQGSWFEPVEQSGSSELFSLIVSNPPYIEKNDPHLLRGDVRFEPLSALVSEQKGLADIRHIAENAGNYLQDKGWLLFEHGFEQGKEVRQLMEKFGYTSVSTEQDYAGNDRVTMGQLVE
ncbi:peptide chain release factor N(5)-glutamine methyltransferase [Vibrio sp. SCSIO 43137]|uniref:peptide chain release factor N(5)-glutamine methyltransferase n=1 Tax=Vibrio sp. SCSIO 43137 TaxID=3021011 RepID=UPI0023073AED|nr:peptide chain release factor N(5)-glutamine methyltransferase [Vibrio sp. SCSIO 43137]WCE29021.1 peptide chain release factor N(5)-glutamine methyltransferase [Vibrio sp. SCSIO 43137]